MKVLVTGASGHLATNTIIQLIEQGYYVRALLRNKKKFLLSNSEYLEVWESDYQEESLSRAIQDCDYIVHIAAEASQGKVRLRYYSVVNVEITQRICSLAVIHGVRKLIYISTANVFGYGSREEPGDETTPGKWPFTASQYVTSKQMAQEIVLSYKNEIDVTVLNPSFLIGPYDQKPGSNRVVLMGLKRKIIFYPPGGKNFVHVLDVALAIASALKLGKNGACYLIANENLSYKEFFTLLGEVLQKKYLFISLPVFILHILGVIGEFLKILGINNEIFLTNMGIVRTNCFYSGKKAQKELQLMYHPVRNALEDSVKWLNDRLV